MIDCEFDTLILSLVLIWIFYVFNFNLQLSKKNKKKNKNIPFLLVDDSQYADLPVTKTPDDIITEEEQAQIDEILKKYDF